MTMILGWIRSYRWEAVTIPLATVSWTNAALNQCNSDQ